MIIYRTASVLAVICSMSAPAADLPRLRKLDRAGVSAALGSFDDPGLAEPEFLARAMHLLDPKRIPGLAEAPVRPDI